MKIYFAHPVTDYGTERQAKAIAGIEDYFIADLGFRSFKIENPDQPHHQAGYAAQGMEYFLSVLQGCTHLAFMRFPDGSVGSGVATEVLWAHTCCLNVYEVFDGRIYPAPHMPTPLLTVEETRATIARIRGEIAA